MRPTCVIAAMLSLLACASQPRQGMQEATAVYEAFFVSYFDQEDIDEPVNLGMRTTPLRTLDWIIQKCAQDIRFEDVVASSLTTRPLGAFASDTRFVLVDGSGASEVALNERRFRAEFGAGLLQVSEVAFDRERKHAIMEFSFVCGPLCGQGELIIFERVGGTWRRSPRLCTSWMS